MAYSTTGVNFDGSVDFMSRGADLTGSVNSKLWSGSFWFKRNLISTVQHIYRTTDGKVVIRFLASNLLAIEAKNAAGAQILNIRTSAITDTAAWHHVCFSVDLATASGGIDGELFIDGASDIAETTFIDDTIDFTVANHTVGANPSGGGPLNGCLADFWIANGQYFDMSVTVNRRKFITANKEAVNLGADGSTPTATAPIMFFRGPFGDFPTNLGSGGNFTEDVGSSIANCADDPDGDPELPAGANAPEGATQIDLVM